MEITDKKRIFVADYLLNIKFVMKKYFHILLFFSLIIGCGQKKDFLDVAKSHLEKAVKQRYSADAKIEGLDTIFTSKKKGTDSIFIVGFKLSVISNDKTERCEYIFSDISGDKKELLTDLLNNKSQSLEEFANEKYRSGVGSYQDLIFAYAAAQLSILGVDVP